MGAKLKHKYTKRVLLVEDDIDLREYLSSELKNFGYCVFQAKNGLEALNTIKVKSLDVILSDISMPIFDGGQLMQWLSRRSNAPPILFMTAMADPKLIEEIKNLGAIAILEKPTKVTDVHLILTQVLEFCNQFSFEYGAPRFGIRPVGIESREDRKRHLNMQLAVEIETIIKARRMS